MKVIIFIAYCILQGFVFSRRPEKTEEETKKMFNENFDLLKKGLLIDEKNVHKHSNEVIELMKDVIEKFSNQSKQKIDKLLKTKLYEVNLHFLNIGRSEKSISNEVAEVREILENLDSKEEKKVRKEFIRYQLK